MSEIKYVIISDLHLGAENSILTNLKNNSYETDNSEAGPVLKALVSCIKKVLEKNKGKQKPKLILNGDILELSMTTTNQSAMAFQRFIELIMPKQCNDQNPPNNQLFDSEIILIPGNHDHHLWETSRYNYFLERLKKTVPGNFIDAPIHVTPMFNPKQIPSKILTTLIHSYSHLKGYRYLKNTKVSTVYPCYAIQNKKKNRCMIMSHGHYIESMYSLMSTIDKMIFTDRIPPSWLADLEADNFAWIDFAWSVLGRSGIVGSDITLGYDKIQSPKQVQWMMNSFVNSYSKNIQGFVKRWIECNVMKDVMAATIGNMAKNERSQDGILTTGSLQGLKKYLEIFVRNQLNAELHNIIPKHVSFLFGHTHKPFEQDMTFQGYENSVQVYNSGGWVVDTTQTMPFHGGSVLFVNDELETVSLNMYKEGLFTPSFQVSGYRQHWDKNSLYKWLIKEINLKEDVWRKFEEEAQKQVELRYFYLKEIIQSNYIST